MLATMGSVRIPAVNRNKHDGTPVAALRVGGSATPISPAGFGVTHAIEIVALAASDRRSRGRIP